MRKLTRNKIIQKKLSETLPIIGKQQMNQLYYEKVQEELAEIVEANHDDIMEFADLVQVVISFAKSNGFGYFKLLCAVIKKSWTHGIYCNNKTIPTTKR